MKHRYRFENGRHLAVVEDDQGQRVSEQAFASAGAAIAARDKLFTAGDQPAKARKPRKAAASVTPAKKK